MPGAYLTTDSVEISAREMALVTGFSVGRIQRLRKSGVIKSTKIGDERMVTLRRDFDAYWNNAPVGVAIDYDLLAEKVADALAKRIVFQVATR